MQNKKFTQITVMIPIPLEAIECSGILDDPMVEIRATKGKIVIESTGTILEERLEM